MIHSHTNRLINETSPYLLQHAHNPVNWYPWGEEALNLAINQNKPILVSIGYSACHWCHVMEKESFENESIAAIMNAHFINIKIDREERPDLDAIYMDAVQTLTGSGGWPLNVFLTPDKKPFYGGTYFPPVHAFNRSSWTDVLKSVSQAWNEKPLEVISQAENLTDHILKMNLNSRANNADRQPLFEELSCHTVFDNLMKTADKTWGGFGRAPKFPQTFSTQFLLHYAHYFNNEDSKQQALLTIDKILQGGIYDHISGGIARYSTDVEWLAPHFEKMLYDNALFLLVLCDAFQITKSEKYAIAIRHIIEYVREEMTDSNGGFYAALDADSEGVEGKFYVWQKKEIDELLGEKSAIFCSYFDVTENGNWEHTNILRTLQPIEEFVEKQPLAKTDLQNQLNRNLQTLKAARAKRVKPGLDDKIILSWNALMQHALIRAASVLEDDSIIPLAENNYRFLMNHFKVKEGEAEMFHTYKNGVAKYPAFLDDYAYLIQSFLSLYQLTFNVQYLHQAKSISEYVLENFSDKESSLLFFTNQSQTDVVIRKKELYDGATPSANAIMAKNLMYLSIFFENADWRNRSESMLNEMTNLLIKYPGSFGCWADLAMHNVMGINEVTIIGPDFKNRFKQIRQIFIPASVFSGAFSMNKDVPILAEKNPGSGTEIFHCKGKICLPSTVSMDVFLKNL
jgi:uncharacterized protein YyaL (SSP411 family)